MRLLVLLLCLLALPAAAEGTKPERFRAAFADWLKDRGATRGVLAIRRDGVPVSVWSTGTDRDAALPLASLSKAITAVCVSELVRSGALTYDTEARAVLGLPAAAPATVAALLNHATGLEHDRTQGAMSWWRDDPTPRWPELTEAALDPARMTAGAAEYYYSNENYAVLGSVIESVTGQDYVTACRDRVLTPAGVRATADPSFAAYLPWGGWRMTMADYAGFLDHYYGNDGVLGGRLRRLPRVRIEGPVHYGLGMVQRDMSPGVNVWHFGSLCFEDGPNFGTYAVHWRIGWTVTAWYDACLEGAGMIALDQAMVRVAYAPE